MYKLLTIAFFGLVSGINAQNCETPKPTQWHNFYQGDSVRLHKQDTYRIQFLSVKHNKPVNVPFTDYVEEQQGCFRRFFVSKYFENLNDALVYLETIKQFYPDAFPIKTNRLQ